MAKEKIKGRIVRILDNRTVVINLGSEQGIKSDSIFHILGEPESVVDPVTKETLGTVKVSKSRVRASQVFDRFTIATTSWTHTYVRLGQFSKLFQSIADQTTESVNVDEGELNVNPGDISPWKAKSASPVKVGDEVEVEVEIEVEIEVEVDPEQLQLEAGIIDDQEEDEEEGQELHQDRIGSDRGPNE